MGERRPLAAKTPSRKKIRLIQAGEVQYRTTPMPNGRRKAVPATQPRYSKEEFARRGDAMYEGEIRASVEPGNEGKFVAIDIETGAHEVDADELAASDRLLARVPNAQIWLKRIGSRYVRRFGPRPQSSGR